MNKVNSTDSGLLLFFVIVSPGRAGAFSRDFTTILAPESRAFSGALKIEKLKAPQIPGPESAVDTNDRCITFYIRSIYHLVSGMLGYIESENAKTM